MSLQEVSQRDKIVNEYNREVRAFTQLPEHPNVLQLLGMSRQDGKLAIVTP
jgi:hypothetical protein